MKKNIIFIVLLCIGNILLSQNNDSINFENHFKLAMTNYKSSKYNMAIKEWNSASKYSTSAYDKARCFMNMGICYKVLSKYDSAFFYYDDAKKLLISIDSLKLLGRINNNLGTLCMRTGSYKKAQEYFLYALKLKKQENDINSIGSTLLNLGEIQLRLKNLERAKEYYNQSLEIRIKVADTLGIASCYINLGILEKGRNEYSNAKNYYDKALKLCDIGFSNDTRIRLVVYENIGAMYAQEGKYRKAYPFYYKALEISQRINSQFDIAHCKNEIAILKLQEGFPDTAKTLALDAFSIANEFNILERMPLYSITISKIYESLGNYKNANEWLKKHQIYKDSVLTIDKIREIQGLEYTHQTQEKENEILKLSNESILKDVKLTKSKYLTYSILGALLLFLGFGYFYWNRRKQQHRLALLENSVKASDQEKSRIGKELHDGIGARIMQLVRESETSQIQLSHQLLHTYNEVRNLSHQLDNTPIHGELFLDRILDVIPEKSENQEFNFKLTPRHLELKEPHGTHIYRIIQELITNNSKHAKATKTSIVLSLEDDTLALNYKDNGIGFSQLKKGNGFSNMEHRTKLMNGAIRFNSELKNGLEVIITIPYITK